MIEVFSSDFEPRFGRVSVHDPDDTAVILVKATRGRSHLTVLVDQVNWSTRVVVMIERDASPAVRGHAGIALLWFAAVHPGWPVPWRMPRIARRPAFSRGRPRPRLKREMSGYYEERVLPAQIQLRLEVDVTEGRDRAVAVVRRWFDEAWRSVGSDLRSQVTADRGALSFEESGLEAGVGISYEVLGERRHREFVRSDEGGGLSSWSPWSRCRRRGWARSARSVGGWTMRISLNPRLIRR